MEHKQKIQPTIGKNLLILAIFLFVVVINVELFVSGNIIFAMLVLAIAPFAIFAVMTHKSTQI